MIYEINEFNGPIWSLDLNLQGTTLIVASSDKSVKMFELTKEQTVLEVENDKRLDNQMNEELEKDLQNNNPNPLNKNSIVPIKKTVKNVTFAETLVEALDLCEKYKEEIYQYEISIVEYLSNIKLVSDKNITSDVNVKYFNLEEPEKPSPPIEMMGKSIFEYVMDTLINIHPLTELENTLNNLPYTYIQKLIFYIEYYIRNRNNNYIATRCFLFLLTIYESQFSADKTLVRLLESIFMNLKDSLEENLSLCNFNYYGIEATERIYKEKMELEN